VNSARVQVQAAGAEAASAEGKAREADRVRKEAEAAQARAAAAAAEAGRAAAQAQAQAKAARGQAEAAGLRMAQSNQAMEVARRQSDELTLASLDLTNRMIIPELRRASSLSAPADAEARIEQAQEALAPLSRANPEAFATAAMALRLEQAEFARASLDTVALAKTIDDFQGAGTTAGLRPALAELSLAQAERFSATADMLRGAPDRAILGLNRAQALLAAPGRVDQDKEDEAAWRKLFQAMTHAELGEALLAQGRGAEAFQHAESCLANISLETIRTIDGKLLEVRCLIIQASGISDEAERGETFELAAQNLLKLARQEPRSTDVDLLKLLLIRQYFSFPDQDGTIDVSQDNMAALVDQVLGKMLSKSYWLDEDGLPTAETMYPMEAWLEAEIVTKFVAASAGMAPDKDAFGVLKPLLTRAWDRMRSLRLYMLSAPVSQDHQLRLHAAQLAQRQLESYVALPATAEWRAATSVFDYQDSLETATGGVQLIASDGAAEERARRALIDHATSIVRAAADRISLTRYPEAQLFVAQTRSSIDAICGGENGSSYGCAELSRLYGEFQAAVTAEEQALTEKLAGRTRGSAAVEIWTDGRGVALAGFDPVTCLGGGDALTAEADSKATFTEICELRKGRYAYGHLWGGQVWLFESEANLAAFKSNPGAYVPQFGGRDTGQLVEASDVALAEVDGSYFVGVADGKRYLFSGTINESGSPVSAIFELTREQLAAAIANGKLVAGGRRR
jgi:YHS domain-containing protein